jgi:hypothetical protein
MGPSEDRPTGEKNQPGHCRTAGRVRHPRHRVCLLKGCERRFRPVHPLARYCSQECREAARRWREWKARHRYRQSEAGKQKRRAQSRRYRLRSKRSRAANPGSGKPREGHRKKKYSATPVTGLAAMRNSRGRVAHPCSDFVRTVAGELWRGFWSGNGVGGNGKESRHGDLSQGYLRTLAVADRG